MPLLFGVRETPTENKASRLQAVREGLAQLMGTFREIRQLRVLLIFLVGYWLYIDGVNTVIKTAVFLRRSGPRSGPGESGAGAVADPIRRVSGSARIRLAGQAHRTKTRRS